MASSACLGAPIIFWASDPVLPDEVVVAQGGGFGSAPVVEVGRLRDDVKSLGMVDLWTLVETPVAVKPLQVSDHSVKFVVPADLKPGLFAFRLKDGGQISRPRFVNAPDVWWLQGDGGQAASPGGWARLFGKCLSFGAGTQVRLATAGAKPVALKPAQAECWSLTVALPKDLRLGEYAVEVHNGFGGAAGWRPAGKLVVAAPEAWKTEVYKVTDFGTDSDAAVRAALAKVEENGGGVVYFPRGRYQIKGDLKLPAGTVLRGEGMGLASLYWPDMDQPPPDLIHGPKFGLEDLSIYVQNHHNVVDDEDNSTGTFLHRVRIRANCFFMIEDLRKGFRGRNPPASHNDCGAAVMVRARNFEITDCDLYASNVALRVFHGKFGVVARNRFEYGGRGYTIENTDGLIYEDNTVRGNNLMAIGNDITTFWTSYSRNIYYARNRLSDMYGADREMMTLDAGGGAYFGKVAATEGTHATLAADPTYMDYAPPDRHHTDWTGGAMIILDGTGAGQWRSVTMNAGREWEVDRPWDIAPDTTSVISIAPHRGRHLFIGNTFEDGGSFQLYGAALDTIVAGNKGSRMDGFFAWGLNPHDWGWQPCYNCQFLDNEILEGNGYGSRSAMLGAFTSNNNEKYAGPLARGIIFRRNVLHSNARIRIHATVDDALVERCTVQNNELGITVGKGPTNLLLRENRFDDVTTPYDGEGLPGAMILR
jgi:hypothetical protein